MSAGNDSASPTWAEVLELVTRLDASGLADAEVLMDGVSVRVSRSVLDGPGIGAKPTTRGAPDSAESESSPKAGDETVSVADHEGHPVTAPMLGTVYLRASPSADPFIAVGDVVSADTTVAIIEVMKMMNNVNAGVSGTVREISVREGAMVEHGDVLLRLDVAP